jgi:hypothetical protein
MRAVLEFLVPCQVEQELDVASIVDLNNWTDINIVARRIGAGPNSLDSNGAAIFVRHNEGTGRVLVALLSLASVDDARQTVQLINATWEATSELVVAGVSFLINCHETEPEHCETWIKILLALNKSEKSFDCPPSCPRLSAADVINELAQKYSTTRRLLSADHVLGL